jgi:hypothetical protein
MRNIYMNQKFVSRNRKYLSLNKYTLYKISSKAKHLVY